jgi:hypothetical protein
VYVIAFQTAYRVTVLLAVKLPPAEYVAVVASLDESHPRKEYPVRVGFVAGRVIVEPCILDTPEGAPEPPFALNEMVYTGRAGIV